MQINLGKTRPLFLFCQQGLLFTLVMAAGLAAGVAQPLEKLRTQYPNDEAVFLSYHRQLNIEVQADTLAAHTTHATELMVLTERNATLFARSSVYHSGFNHLQSLEAYTRLPDGKTTLPIGPRKTSMSASNSVFYDDAQETSFDYPAMQPGAVAVQRYTLEHRDCHLLSPFMYAGRLPAAKVRFTITAGPGVQIAYQVRNDAQKRFAFTQTRQGNQTVYQWVMKNVRNPTAFADSPDEYYYLPHIVVYVKSYTNSKGVQPFFGTVKQLYAWNAAFLKGLNETEDPELRRITDSLTRGINQPLDKAARIYHWVQTHIRYVAFENGLEGFRPRQAAEVCSKRYGDCKDMSSIITKMLRMAGIEAYYTWIGTRDLPFAYEDVPLPIVDNHMISTARINNQWYFLDGTAPFATLTHTPYHIQGKEALVAKGPDAYEILTVPVTPYSGNVLIDSTFITISPKGVEGRQSLLHTGAFAADLYGMLLYRHGNERTQYVKTRLTRGSNKFMLGNYTVSEAGTHPDTLLLTATYELPDYGKKAGNEYYINLNLNKLFENQTIDTSLRKVPRLQNFAYTWVQHHILQIPEGYKVTYTPKNLEVNNPHYHLQISYQQKGTQLIATQTLQLTTWMLYPNQFTTWNKDLPAIQAHYKEQVVLEKP